MFSNMWMKVFLRIVLLTAIISVLGPELLLIVNGAPLHCADNAFWDSIQERCSACVAGVCMAFTPYPPACVCTCEPNSGSCIKPSEKMPPEEEKPSPSSILPIVLPVCIIGLIAVVSIGMFVRYRNRGKHLRQFHVERPNLPNGTNNKVSDDEHDSHTLLNRPRNVPRMARSTGMPENCDPEVIQMINWNKPDPRDSQLSMGDVDPSLPSSESDVTELPIEERGPSCPEQPVYACK